MKTQKIKKNSLKLFPKIDSKISWYSGNTFNRVKVFQKEKFCYIEQKIGGIWVLNLSRYTFDDLKKIIIESATSEIEIY